MYLAILAPLLYAGMSLVSAQGSQRPEHVVELYVAVDKLAYKNYEKSGVPKDDVHKAMIYDLIRVTDQINSYLSTLKDNNLDLKVQLNGFEIANGNRTVIPSQGPLKTEDAVPLLNAFLKSKNGVAYDIGMLWTGHDLVKNGVSVDGVSTESDVCKKGLSGLSVIRTSATQEMAWRATREIAKILGAKVQDKPGCEGHLMSSNKFAKNRWAFSECTAGTIKDELEKLSANKINCLGPADYKLPITPKSLGLPENLDSLNKETVCKRTLWASKARYCSQEKLYLPEGSYGDKLCDGIYCSTSAKMDNCSKVLAPEGLECSPNKICKSGKCASIYQCEGPDKISTCCGKGTGRCKDKEFLSKCCEFCTNPPLVCVN